jgi:hypothetical protein
MDRRLAGLWALGFGVAVGCSSTGQTDSGPFDAGDSGLPEDAGVDGGPDGGIPDSGFPDSGPDSGIPDGGDAGAATCPSDAHQIDGGCDSWPIWDAGVDFPLARDHHVTFLIEVDGGAYLYVSGGNNYVTRMRDTHVAAIQPDGNLGAWTLSTALPATRAGHSVEVFGDQVFIISGQGGTAHTFKDVLGSRANADGTLSPWVTASDLPFGRFHLATAQYNGWIYLSGGLDDSFMSSPLVLGLYVQPDGGLTGLQAMTTLPTPRDHHSSFAYAGHLYVVGGEYVDPVTNQSTALNDVLSAPIHDDGKLGDWSEVSTLDTPWSLETQANFVHEGWLYLLGGLEIADGGGGSQSVTSSAAVRRAPIDSDGAIGAWEEVDPLPLARAHVHKTPVYNGRVYSVCGSKLTSDGPVVLPDVSIGMFQ